MAFEPLIGSVDALCAYSGAIRGVRMLDLAGIMFSSIMMLMVIVQAVRLDQAQPWFQAIKRKGKPSGEKRISWRRQS